MEHLNSLFGIIRTLVITVVLVNLIGCTTSSYTILDSIESHRKCVGDCYNGYGKSFYEHQPSKVLYEGNWKNGMESGEGTAYFEDGRVRYKGSWEKGLMHGEGMLYDQLTGNLLYEGDFLNGLMDGEGMLYSKYGGVYLGQFSKGQKQSRGTYTYEDGSTLNGNWKNGVLVGNNTLKAKENEPRKEAPVELIHSRCLVPGDCKNGTGVLVYFNGSKYEGGFEDAKRHGTGTFYDKSGRMVYQGGWNSNLKHGKGIMYYENGKKWIVGNWNLGQKHGEITYYYKTGEKYAIEQFENGVSERLQVVINE